MRKNKEPSIIGVSKGVEYSVWTGPYVVRTKNIEYKLI